MSTVDVTVTIQPVASLPAPKVVVLVDPPGDASDTKRRLDEGPDGEWKLSVDLDAAPEDGTVVTVRVEAAPGSPYRVTASVDGEVRSDTGPHRRLNPAGFNLLVIQL